MRDVIILFLVFVLATIAVGLLATALGMDVVAIAIAAAIAASR